MFRPNQLPKDIENVNVLISDGGMGDILCYLITVDYMVKELPHINSLIWVPDYVLDFAKNVLPEKAIVRDYTTAKKKYNDKLSGVSTQWKTAHTAMRIHPTNYANHMLIDTDLPIEKMNYLKFNNEGIDLSRFNLPTDYMVMSVGSTAKTKELSPEILNQIADYINSKGYIPVFMGKTESIVGAGPRMTANIASIDYTNGIDLTDKTNLVETAAIISKARAFVGMEGGLTHLAGFTDVKMVVGYSFADPKRMAPIRNNIQGYNINFVLPEESLACRFCQTNVSLLYGQDFKFCMYDDYLCVKQLTIDKWTEQIDKVIS